MIPRPATATAVCRRSEAAGADASPVECREDSVHGLLSIDVGSVMRETLARTQADLVTRPTGRAVREAIEGRIACSRPPVSVSVIDLTRIRVLDFSCADEVVARLLLRYLPPERPRDAFFLFRAVKEVHGHALGEVLARHGLAAVCTFGGGGFRLLGTVSRAERQVWFTLEQRERIHPGASASLFGEGGRALLGRLCERRLAYRDPASGSVALSALARTVGSPNPHTPPTHPGALP